MSELFEKDNITAIANAEITPYLALRLGQALAYVISRDTDEKVRVLIGKDTRASGDMLEAAIAAGICSMGAEVVSLGVIPAPATAFLTAKYKMSAAVIISAAHLPIEYNGIKFLDSQGSGLSTDKIIEIEEYALEKKGLPDLSSVPASGRIRKTHTGLRDYADYVKSTSTESLSGLKIAVDSANGACFECTKLIFTELGADVESINNRPDGLGINSNCGTVDTQMLQKFVVSHKCTVGFAFNGDGTDYVAIDKSGQKADAPVLHNDAIVSALSYACNICDNITK